MGLQSDINFLNAQILEKNSTYILKVVIPDSDFEIIFEK